MTTQQKPLFSHLRELQRQYLLLRWESICARGDQAFYARTIDTHVVTFALGRGLGSEVLGVEGPSVSTDGSAVRSNLPSSARSASPMLSTYFLLMDAASCGLLTQRRRFSNFGDGMISYNESAGKITRSTEAAAHTLQLWKTRLNARTRSAT